MKNRTIIGIVCLILSLVLCFVVAPAVTSLFEQPKQVVVLKSDVAQGVQIEASMLDTVSVTKLDTLSMKCVSEPNDIIGKYAKTYLYKGLVNSTMFVDELDTTESRLMSLGAGECAMSITVQSLAGGVSAKLQPGDIITIVTLDDDDKAVIYDELRYVEVLATTDENGADVESANTGDEEAPLPETITVKLIDSTQIERLVEAENGKLHAVFVSRNPEQSEEYLKWQLEYFEKHGNKSSNEEVDKSGT